MSADTVLEAKYEYEREKDFADLLSRKIVVAGNPYLKEEIAVCIMDGKTAEIKEYLNKGWNLNSPIISGEYALVAAVRLQKTDIVKLLLDFGAKTDMSAQRREDDWGCPLTVADACVQWAVYNNDFEILQYLHERGVPIRGDMTDGSNALHYVGQNPHPKIIAFLIDCGVDIFKKDRWGASAIEHAAYVGDIDAVYRMAMMGADLTNMRLTSVDTFTLLRSFENWEERLKNLTPFQKNKYRFKYKRLCEIALQTLKKKEVLYAMLEKIKANTKITLVEKQHLTEAFIKTAQAVMQPIPFCVKEISVKDIVLWQEQFLPRMYKSITEPFPILENLSSYSVLNKDKKIPKKKTVSKKKSTKSIKSEKSSAIGKIEPKEAPIKVKRIVKASRGCKSGEEKKERDGSDNR